MYLDGVLQASGYTVSGVGNDNGGNVDFTTAPANGIKVTLLRTLPLTQLTDLPTQGPLSTTSVENQLDRLAMLTQQMQEQIDRALLLVVESTLSGLTLTPAASNYLQWNASADGITNVASVTPSTTTVSPFMETLLDDLDKAAGRATLGAAEDALVVKLAGAQTLTGKKQLDDFNGTIVGDLVLKAQDVVIETDTDILDFMDAYKARDIEDAAYFGIDGRWVHKSGLSWVTPAMRVTLKDDGADIDIEFRDLSQRGAHGTIIHTQTITGVTGTSIYVAFGYVFVGHNAGADLLSLHGDAVTVVRFDGTTGHLSITDLNTLLVAIGLDIRQTDGRGRPFPALALMADLSKVYIPSNRRGAFNKTKSTGHQALDVHRRWVFVASGDSDGQLVYPDVPLDMMDVAPGGNGILKPTAAPQGLQTSTFARAAGDIVISGGTDGFNIVTELSWRGPALQTNLITAMVTKDYSTGFFGKDIRGIWVANSLTDDRSYKGNDLTDNDGVTLGVVETGAELQAASGFDVDTYLSRPFDADLDMGTTAFGGIAWFKNPGATTNEYILRRSDTNTTGVPPVLWAVTGLQTPAAHGLVSRS